MIFPVNGVEYRADKKCSLSVVCKATLKYVVLRVMLFFFAFGVTRVCRSIFLFYDRR